MSLPPPSSDEVAAQEPKSWGARISLGWALGLGAAAFVALVALSELIDAIKNLFG